MKKMFCLFIVIVVLMCSIPAHCEENITFRGIPWGSSVEETLQTLKDDFGSSIQITNLGCCESYSRSFGSVKAAQTDGVFRYDFPRMIVYKVQQTQLIKVAGFQVNWILLYFIPNYDMENHSYSDSEGKLFCANYGAVHGPFDPNQKTNDIAYGEISEKLDGLYGTHETIESKAYYAHYNYDFATGRLTSKNRVLNFNQWNSGTSFIACIPEYGYNKGTWSTYNFIQHAHLFYWCESEWLMSSIADMNEILQYQKDEALRIEQQRLEEEKDTRGVDGL